MIINMVCLAQWILICHMIFTKIGLTYVDLEILREGNEQLLDNLEEGVIILEEDTLNLFFMNEAAKTIHKEYDFLSFSEVDNRI